MTTLTLTDSEFRLLREYIEKQCGVMLGDEKAYLVESRLASVLTQFSCSSFGDLYRKAISQPALGLRDKIVDAITTHETLWFRDGYPFEVIKNVILKQYAAEIQAGTRRKIRIWSAACSTGQEPYSIAMLLHDFARSVPVSVLRDTEIVATDISPSALFLAIAGRYDQIAMSRGLSTELRDRYFSPVGKIWAINDQLKKNISFRRFNLQDDFSSLGKFDIILCRNVLIYFSDDFKRDVLGRMAELLRPSGYLFLGASESAGQYSNSFSMMTHNKHLFYQVTREARK